MSISFVKTVKNICGAEKGEPAALLLSPSHTPPLISADFSRQPSGSLFTIFLTSPVQAFCLLSGISASDMETVGRDKASFLA